MGALSASLNIIYQVRRTSSFVNTKLIMIVSGDQERFLNRIQSHRVATTVSNSPHTRVWMCLRSWLPVAALEPPLSKKTTGTGVRCAS